MLSDKDEPGWSFRNSDGFSDEPFTSLSVGGFTLELTTQPRGGVKLVNWRWWKGREVVASSDNITARNRNERPPIPDMLAAIGAALKMLPDGSYFNTGSEVSDRGWVPAQKCSVFGFPLERGDNYPDWEPWVENHFVRRWCEEMAKAASLANR